MIIRCLFFMAHLYPADRPISIDTRKYPISGITRMSAILSSARTTSQVKRMKGIESIHLDGRNTGGCGSLHSVSFVSLARKFSS